MKPVPDSKAEEMCQTAVFNFGSDRKVESHHFWFVKHREGMHCRSGKMLTPTVKWEECLGKQESNKKKTNFGCTCLCSPENKCSMYESFYDSFSETVAVHRSSRCITYSKGSQVARTPALFRTKPAGTVHLVSFERIQRPLVLRRTRMPSVSLPSHQSQSSPVVPSPH